MQVHSSNLPKGLANYLSDLLFEFPLTPQAQPSPHKLVAWTDCGAAIAGLRDPIPEAPRRPHNVNGSTLRVIADHIAGGTGLHTSAELLGLPVHVVATAVATLGTFTTRQWRNTTPPRGKDPVPDGYRRSRKHPYSLERSAITIRASHTTGSLTDRVITEAAARLTPPDPTAEDLRAPLSFWAFRTRLVGGADVRAEDNVPEYMAHNLHVACSAAHKVITTAAEELAGLLSGHKGPAPTLENLLPQQAEELRAAAAARRVMREALRRSPDALLPTSYAELTSRQTSFIAGAASTNRH